MSALKNNLFASAFITLLTLLFFSTSSGLAQETGAIQGKVTDENQDPITDINIGLEGTQLGNASDNQGNFMIRRVPAGSYTIVASGVGYSTERKEITVENGQLLNVNVQLSQSNQQLQEITVSAEKINKFSTDASEYVAKMPIRDIENPQVYNSVNTDLIEDQVITDFDDVIKNAPGVFSLWSSTGRGGDGAAYYSIRGFSVQPNMVNGIPSITNGTLDPAGVERVEVIKGPSATLFGNSVTSYGGLINIVTKKPYETFGGNVSYQTGSFGLNRVTADVNTPVGGDNDILLRIDGAYQKSDSFQDTGLNESFYLAPALTYQANENLSFDIYTEFYQSERTNPIKLFLNRAAPLEFNNISEFNYDPNESFTSNSLTLTNPTFRLQGRMNYQISDNWTSTTILARSSTQSDGYGSYVSTIGVPGNNFARFIKSVNSTTNGTNIQQNFNGDFKIGNVRNRLLIGLDFFQQQLTDNGTAYVPYDMVDITNPNPTSINRQELDTMLASAPVAQSKSEQEVYSAYISDVIEIIPQLSVMASVRLDHFVNDGSVDTEEDDFNQTTLSPKFGIVFQPIPEKLSFFGNYMNSFNNVAPTPQGDGSIATFGPERANQWEAGIKANLFNGRLTATASYYDIKVSDLVRQDPNRPNFSIQDGEQYSRGIELSLNAAPINGMNVTAGYSHNNSKLSKISNPALLDRRPEQAGPSDLFNAWASYRLPNGALRGLGFGFGANYASDNYTINRANTGRFTLPAYTVFNASAFYDTNDFRITLKLNNFTDEEYYTGWTTVTPQQPRNLTASFSYKF